MQISDGSVGNRFRVCWELIVIGTKKVVLELGGTDLESAGNRF